MVSSRIGFNISGTDDFVNAATSLENVEQEFPNWVYRTISDEAESLKARAGERLMSTPVHGKKQTGLRAAIVQGMKVTDFSDNTGKGVRLLTTVPESDMAYIPKGLDTGISAGWRHPVFGNKSKWVRQTGDDSWFANTMKTSRDDIESKISADMDEAVKQISTS